MAPRISYSAARSLSIRPRSIIPQKRVAYETVNRAVSDDSSQKPSQEVSTQAPSDANQEAIPHVSEEQAAIDKVMGETPPQIDEQGTPVQEMLARDKNAQKTAPTVIKQQMAANGSGADQKRSFSTSIRRCAEATEQIQFEGTKAVGLLYPDAGLGHKFPLPDSSSYKKTDHMRRRYDSIVDQVTKSIMRDGKLSQAQSNMSDILDILRTAPPPQINPAVSTNRLLSDNTIETEKLQQYPISRDALPFSPIQYLTSTIDSVAPLVKIRQQRGIMGGGASLPIPVPMRVKARRRTAIKWILDSASNRKEVKLAERVAREIINVAEGKGGAWEKRALVHRTAISARSNIRLMMVRRSR